MSERFGLFYSPKCPHCMKLIGKINENAAVKGLIDVIDIGKCSREDISHIRSVPTLQHEKTRQQFVGRKAYEQIDEMLKEHIDAFEMGFGTNTFSYVENESALCQGSTGYTYLTEEGFETGDIQTVNKSAPVRGGADSSQDMESKQNVDLEALMEARKNDIPTPVARA